MSYPTYQVPAGDVLPVMFTSYAGTTGASVTLTGLAVTDIEIYKDGSVIQRASDAGYTLLDTDGIDFDAITGIHGFSIDTGDNTDAGFYTVGAWFTVVVSAVTIDAQTVNFIACQFRLMAAEAIAGKPKSDVDGWLGTACATPTVAGVPEVDVTHIGGDAQSGTDLKDFADAGYDPATNKVQGVVLVDTLTTYTGNTVQTGDSFARLGAPAGASVSADLLAIDNFVDGLETTIGAAGAGLTAVSLSAAGVDAIWDEVLTDATHNVANSAGRRLRQLAAISALDGRVNDAAATTGSFVTDLASAVNDFYKDQLLIFTSGALIGQSKPVAGYNGTTKTATFDELFTSAPANTDTFSLFAHHIHPVTQISDAVWEEAQASHTTAGTFGEIATEIASVLADTNELQTDWVNGGRLDLILDARASQTSVNDLPTNAELTTALGTADDAVLTQVALVKAKTDLIPAAPAAVGDIPTAAQNATAVLTTQMTESYRADGAAPTLAQATCEVLAHMGEVAISGTTKTIKKLDGTTTAETFTLDSATAPTSITRTT